MDGPPGNDCCSICHGSFNIPHQANCSHWYCGNCILQVWNHGSSLQPCKCPLCRRQITLLVPSQASSQQIHNPEAAEILKKIEAYNRLFGSQSTNLSQRVQDLPFLLKRLFRELMDPQRSLPFVIKARLYLALISTAVYVLSPVDIIPEALFGILGLLDDVIIALTFFLHVGTLYRSTLLRRYGGSSG
ncbi:putative transcription factor C2H2 family [Helianthus annuus]|nr:putative transcription factor C2H2 family [Helianthus annuus]KAJ0760200.1 putative transcription factor C2H2 family [Helianthus annuus]KAJ0929962.1 putative transcription factor C2H2 family [Helianthus annuus]